MTKMLKLSSFWLKLIAIITMTLTHFVVIYCKNPYYVGNSYQTLYKIGYIIGRIALPLFTFMLVEGMCHTHNKLLYLLRITFTGLIVTLVTIIIEQGYNTSFNDGNVFIDLTLGAWLIYCIELNRFKKFYTLIPVALIALLLTNNYTDFLLTDCIKLEYGIYGILLILGFYVSKIFKKIYVKYCSVKYGIDEEGFNSTSTSQLWSNIFATLSLIIVNLCCGVVISLFPSVAMCNWKYQQYAILAIIFILMYNGQRGYNAKWFQYGCYIYYPLHLAILYLFTFII